MSDLFISYAHEDSDVVARLRTALTEAGRDVWVDTSGIVPSDRWRTSAEEAIDRTDAVVFVISRHSLHSRPCLEELAHATAANKRIIPVCVDEAAADMDKPDALGDLSWIMLRPPDDFAAGVAAVGTALDTDLDVVRQHTRILVRARAWELAGRRASPLLRGEELRSAEQWLARAARAGTPPNELQQEFIAASRRATARRLGILAGVAATVAVIAIVLSVFALVQRSHAIQEASVATSRQLAALSESELSSNLDGALLLAVRAYRTEPNAQARAALLQADLYSPSLSRFVTMGAPVTALAGAGANRTVVAGLSDGRVMRWTGGTPVALGHLRGFVGNVAISADGRTVAAAGGGRALLWRGSRGSLVGCPTPQRPDTVGLSPSGATLIVHCEVGSDLHQQSIEVVATASGLIAATHRISADLGAPDLVLSSDSSVLLFASGLGPWQQRSLPGWQLQAASSGTLGNHQGVSGVSPDGRFVTATNGDPTIPVWPTASPTMLYPDSAPYTAQAPISAVSALTLSPGGGTLAAADTGTIYVARVLAARAAHPSAYAMPGNGSINPDGLRFTGDSAHLISATGSTVALWDLDQFDRLATVQTTSLQSPCEGCQGALTAVSPDGRRVAAVTQIDGVVQGLAPGSAAEPIPVGALGPPLWDGTELLLPETSGLTGPPPRLPAGVRLLPPVHANLNLVAAGLLDAGREVAVVDANGDVFIQAAGSGRVLREIRGPADLSGNNATPLLAGEAAVDSALGTVAIDDRGAVRLTDATSGRDLATLPATAAPSPSALISLGGVTFAGPRLVIEEPDGSVEVYNARGTVRERLIGGDGSYAYFPPVADPTGQLLARERSNGTVALVDLASGATLATLPIPISPAADLRIGLAFTPGGTGLVSVVQTISGLTPLLFVRRLDPATLVRAACRTAGRSLTPGEWREFVGTAPPADLVCH